MGIIHFRHYSVDFLLLLGLHCLTFKPPPCPPSYIKFSFNTFQGELLNAFAIFSLSVIILSLISSQCYIDQVIKYSFLRDFHSSILHSTDYEHLVLIWRSLMPFCFSVLFNKLFFFRQLSEDCFLISDDPLIL